MMVLDLDATSNHRDCPILLVLLVPGYQRDAVNVSRSVPSISSSTAHQTRDVSGGGVRYDKCRHGFISFMSMRSSPMQSSARSESSDSHNLPLSDSLTGRRASLLEFDFASYLDCSRCHRLTYPHPLIRTPSSTHLLPLAALASASSLKLSRHGRPTSIVKFSSSSAPALPRCQDELVL